MKRFVGACVIFVICLITLFSSDVFGSFSEYSEKLSEVRASDDNLSEITEDMARLERELEVLRGPDVPRTLRQIMAYVQGFEGVTINSIRAFELNGGTLHFIKNVTNLNDPVICDGFEINLSVSNIVGFIQYFDESNISYTSVDLLFASEVVVLRVRTGGNS